MAVLIPCLKKLFDEFDEIASGRDKDTDGWIGDTSHQTNVSDHNPDETGNTPERDSDKVDEVHAIDVDKDLREDFTMEDCVQFILGECRKDSSVGKDRGRLKYIIFNRRIWEAPNWKQQSYSGSNPHDKHAHFSAEYDTEYESDTSTWGLVERFGNVALSDADKKWIQDLLITQKPQSDSQYTSTGVGRAVMDFQDIPNEFLGAKTSLWEVLKNMQEAIMSIQSTVESLLETGTGEIDGE